MARRLRSKAGSAKVVILGRDDRLFIAHALPAMSHVRDFWRRIFPTFSRVCLYVGPCMYVRL